MTTTRARERERDAVIPIAPLAKWAQPEREGIVASVVALGLLATIAMWWTNTTSLHGWASEWTAAGRVLGLAGTYLLLVQVLLMARVPVLDRFIGMDRLAVWHRRNGEYVVALLTAHVAAITLGYALAAHQTFAWETGTLIRRYPDMLAATVAMALLVTVGVTSARIARRRMKYQTWYFVHLYAYLAVVLAFAHQLNSGNEFATHPASRWFWIALHLIVLAALLIFRVGVPLALYSRHQLRVDKVEQETPDTVSIWMTGRALNRLRGESGQFFLWRFLTRDGWWQAHPFSLSRAPDGRRLRITVKGAGDYTNWLPRVKRGTRVFAEGPYGACTAERRSRDKVLFVAGGIGVAPLRALFESIPARRGTLSFIYRARSEADFALRDELEKIARKRDARLAFISGSRDDAAFDPEIIRSAVPDVADHDVFVCGSTGFVDHAIEALRDAGADQRHLHAERFEL